MKYALVTNAIISATIMADQIPSKAKNIGNIITQPHSKIIVLTKDIIAEIKPLFNAVKNAEAYILNPHSKNDIA